MCSVQAEMLRVLVFALCALACLGAQLDDVFEWKTMEFDWPNAEAKQKALDSKGYIPNNNLPLGLARWNDKLFVTVPRWKAGVAASLTYVPLNATGKSPALRPYPNWKANTLPDHDHDHDHDHEHEPDANAIVSTFRVDVDACDRLWVMDTGLADILGSPRQLAKPALVVFDLKTDRLVRRYEFKPTDLKENSFFANVVVDVDKNDCDNAFAYVPDLGGYGLVVYSWKNNDSWRIKHNFFHFDPLNGDFNVDGVNFQWTDGVFGLALSKVQPNGYKTLYFHALASTKEFKVSTEILRNQTLATDPHTYYEYKIAGDKGKSTQTSGSSMDRKTGVIFMTQLNRNAVACWNTNKPLNSENFGVVAQDNKKLIFPNDLKVDKDHLWVLSDRMPSFIYKQLDPKEINYRIMRVKISDAIANTPCA